MIATLDLSRWHAGRYRRRRRGAEVDAGPAAGRLHPGDRPRGGPGAGRRGARGRRGSSSRCPTRSKQRYSVPVGGHGWIGPGAEANAYAEGTETPPDLKESFSLGAETATGDPQVDRIWFAPNVWPAEVPSTAVAGRRVHRGRCVGCPTTCWRCSRTRCACRTTRSPTRRARPTWTMNINHYPPVSVGGRARAGPVPHRSAHRLRHRHHPRP